MLPIKARLGYGARKLPTRDLPNLAIKFIALFDPAARAIIPDLGVEVRVDNTATCKALGMEFIGVEDSAPAMAESLLRLGLI